MASVRGGSNRDDVAAVRVGPTMMTWLLSGGSKRADVDAGLCARISNHTDLKNISHSIFIPIEPSSSSSYATVGARYHSSC